MITGCGIDFLGFTIVLIALEAFGLITNEDTRERIAMLRTIAMEVVGD